jgi:hypothetical protein
MEGTIGGFRQGAQAALLEVAGALGGAAVPLKGQPGDRVGAQVQGQDDDLGHAVAMEELAEHRSSI